MHGRASFFERIMNEAFLYDMPLRYYSNTYKRNV